VNRLLAAVLLLLLPLAGCEEKLKPAVSPAVTGGQIPAQESWNATIRFTDSGKVKGILRAGHIAAFSDRKVTYLDSNIAVDFFDEEEHHTSVLTARRGKVDDATKDFEAHDNVVVVSDSGTILKTEELFWDNNRQKIHTTAYVEITSPTEQIRGHGLESDRGLKEYRIFRVTGQAVKKP
jgi:LPS export ABC transporter protein LptC